MCPRLQVSPETHRSSKTVSGDTWSPWTHPSSFCDINCQMGLQDPRNSFLSGSVSHKKTKDVKTQGLLGAHHQTGECIHRSYALAFTSGLVVHRICGVGTPLTLLHKPFQAVPGVLMDQWFGWSVREFLVPDGALKALGLWPTLTSGTGTPGT